MPGPGEDHGLSGNNMRMAGAADERLIEMVKKDINFIKHIKPQVKARENQDRVNSHRNRMRVYQLNANVDPSLFESEEDRRQKEVCKEAAVMDNRERLIYYAGTGNATYLGNDCKWDLLTRLGLRKKKVI